MESFQSRSVKMCFSSTRKIMGKSFQVFTISSSISLISNYEIISNFWKLFNRLIIKLGSSFEDWEKNRNCSHALFLWFWHSLVQRFAAIKIFRSSCLYKFQIIVLFLLSVAIVAWEKTKRASDYPHKIHHQLLADGNFITSMNLMSETRERS